MRSLISFLAASHHKVEKKFHFVLRHRKAPTDETYKINFSSYSKQRSSEMKIA